MFDFMEPRQVKQSEQEKEQFNLAQSLWNDREGLRQHDTDFVNSVRGLNKSNYQDQLQTVQGGIARPGRTNLTGFIGSELNRGAATAGVRETSKQGYQQQLEQAIRRGRGMQSVGVQGVNTQAVYGANNQYDNTQRKMNKDSLMTDALGAGLAAGIGQFNGVGNSQQDSMLGDQWSTGDTVASFFGR